MKKWLPIFVLVTVSWKLYSQQVHPIVGFKIRYTDRQGYEDINWVPHDGSYIEREDIFSSAIDVPHNGNWYFKIISVNSVNCDGGGSEWIFKVAEDSELPQKPELRYEVN
jgi:hypothetical protein